MDEALIENFNSVVTDQDIVYLLGDVVWKTANVDDYMSRLKGKEHHLIVGNHDNPRRWGNQFLSVNDVKLLNIPGYPQVWLSHYSHRVWPASHYKSIHLFGHSHGTLRIDPEVRCCDVGVDAWNYKPVSLDEVVEYLKTH
jgi:calcineurin-like phosphoesterase family protein